MHICYIPVLELKELINIFYKKFSIIKYHVTHFGTLKSLLIIRYCNKRTIIYLKLSYFWNTELS